MKTIDSNRIADLELLEKMYAPSEIAILYDWLPSEIASTISPRVAVVTDELRNIMVQNHWPSDTLFCFGSQQDPQHVVAGLREMCQTDPISGEPIEGICGVDHPEIIRQLLEIHESPWKGKFNSIIDVVLLPSSDCKAGWSLLAHRDLKPELIQAGISPVAKTLIMSSDELGLTPAQ